MHAARTTKDIDLTLHDGSHLSTIRNSGRNREALIDLASGALEAAFHCISNGEMERADRTACCGHGSRHSDADRYPVPGRQS